jgi:hypothetical protein
MQKKKPRAKNVFGTWSPAKAEQSPRFLIPDCKHWRQKFDLEDGLHVFASAWFDKPSNGERSKGQGFAGRPDVGFYLDTRWASESLLVSPGFDPRFAKKADSSRIILYPWEDWGVPERPQVFRRALRWLLTEASRGKTVEIACMGGHGRTGTTLACLLVTQGLSHSRAASKVWARYWRRARPLTRRASLASPIS